MDFIDFEFPKNILKNLSIINESITISYNYTICQYMNLKDVYMVRLLNAIMKKFNGIMLIKINDYDVPLEILNKHIMMFIEFGFTRKQIVLFSDYEEYYNKIIHYFLNNNCITYDDIYTMIPANKIFFEEVDGDIILNMFGHNDPHNMIIFTRKFKKPKINDKLMEILIDIKFKITNIFIEYNKYSTEKYIIKKLYKMLNDDQPIFYTYNSINSNVTYDDFKSNCISIKSLEKYFSKLSPFGKTVIITMDQIIKYHVKEIHNKVPRIMALKSNDIIPMSLPLCENWKDIYLHDKNKLLGTRIIHIPSKILISKSSLNTDNNIILPHIGTFIFVPPNNLIHAHSKSRNNIVCSWLPDDDSNIEIGDFIIEQYITALKNNDIVQLYDFGFFTINNDNLVLL